MIAVNPPIVPEAIVPVAHHTVRKCGNCRTPVTNVKVSNDMIKKQMFAQFTRA